MDVTPRYLGGDSFLGRRDPRVLLLVPALYVVAVAQIDDVRIMLGCAVVAFTYYSAAGIPWRAVRANWIFVLGFITMIVVVNTILTGSMSPTTPGASTVLFTVPLLGTVVSVATISYAVTLFLRFVTIATVGFPIAYAIAPADMGVAFARLGMPQRMAYAIDLTFRFLPSTWASVHETIDAQRVRGYDHRRGGRNPVARLLALRPVVVPVTVNALVDAEDTIDAMDLRGFGTGKRTWLRDLAFDRTDLLVIAGFCVLAALMTAANVTGFADSVWVP